MKKLMFAILLFVATLSCASAQNIPSYSANGVAISVRNTGNNLISELFKEDSIFNFNIAVASFGPGKRLDWHSHPGCQILIITEGIGYYQERGKARQIVNKGEIIKCLPGVEHWHGASSESMVTYMATYSTLKGTTKWLEKVSDDQFNGKN
ncbi:cupin domain-containing protein [Mucilaginibacter sp.]|jgi:quercetin dioxygenase-like cupin family protein|uniref:cupin domain-containing protein n=1 Tax=Mucilaginibacter sp. TaxID=1882438 RepID=UPI0035628F5C